MINRPLYYDEDFRADHPSRCGDCGTKIINNQCGCDPYAHLEMEDEHNKAMEGLN